MYKRQALSYAKRNEGVSARDAVDLLYASAGRQKRSYIRHFAALVHTLGAGLKHADTIPRALGLKLVKALEGDPKLKAQILSVLAANPDRDAEGEVQILASALTVKAPKTAQAKSVTESARTTFKLNQPEGVAKCTATDGRFEIQLDRNFGTVDPRKLEAAVRALLDQLRS